MTVIKTKDDTILSLKQEIGKLVSGKPRYKTYSYTNIDVEASDEKVYASGKALAALFADPIDKIIRQDVGQLVEESNNP